MPLRRNLVVPITGELLTTHKPKSHLQALKVKQTGGSKAFIKVIGVSPCTLYE